MMIAFINNVSVWGQTKCNIHVLRHLEGNTDSFSVAQQKRKTSCINSEQSDTAVSVNCLNINERLRSKET